MAIIDIILLICFVPAIVYGIRKGFVRQVVEIVAIVAGVWAAFRFSALLSTWLSQYLTLEQGLLQIISFVIIVLLAVLLLGLLGSLLTRLLKLVFLGWINGLLGLVFGVLKVALVLGLLIMVFEGINSTVGLVDPESLGDAVVYQTLKKFASDIFPFLKSFAAEAGSSLDITI
jgi:membrane protein required for colicin V production